MSKTHAIDQSTQDDLDAQLDEFIKTNKVAPSVAQSASTGISAADMFGGGSEKKKPLLKRILAQLRSLFNQDRVLYRL